MEQVIIYGAGVNGKKYYGFLKSLSMENIIYAFCDKNYEQIKNIDKIPVYPYRDLKNKGILFIISVLEQEEICRQLENDGQVYYSSIEAWVRDSPWDGDLNLGRAVRVYGGFCPCCKENTLFLSFDYWLRDHYKCLLCDSIPRQRALMKVLEDEMPGWRDMAIHESAPIGNIFQILKQQCPGYTYSYWYESEPLGMELKSGGTNQNLENLTFEKEMFDIFITQDVLEHIDRPEKALAEITRTLKKGGVHIFTTPLYPFKKTTARIKMNGNQRELILPPIYHGNPISNDGALVTYEWGGCDFLEILDKATGMESKIVEFPNSKENFENGLEGDFLQVIVSRKR